MAIDETGWRNFHPEGIKPGMLSHSLVFSSSFFV
jgi:hypothetical protein